MTSPRIPPSDLLSAANDALRSAVQQDAAAASDMALLRAAVIAAGLCWSVVFIVIGLASELQMYADGSIFSYAVAVQDAWAFHWRNISGRVFVYLFSFVPAETYVALTGDARGGIALYGLLQFAAPLLGLAATFAADRSKGRIIFVYACASTACLCPLVFGFPTELWMSHTVFWPALAICRDERAGVARLLLVFVTLLALVLTHGGALIFALAIVAALMLRGGPADVTLLRAGGALLAAVAVWTVVKVVFPPGSYFGSIMMTAALMLVDVTNLANPALLVLSAALAGYGIAFLALRRLNPANAHIYAALIAAGALAVYWLWLDRSLSANDRYALRTALLFGTPVFGALAAAFALNAEGWMKFRVPFLPQLMGALTTAMMARAAAGALALVMLAHSVENAKFVAGWAEYKAAVRTLAMGTASDPELGDPNFVSSARIPADINRLSWISTTPYLSVLLAPQFAPRRLVVDPNAGYFWLPCPRAVASQEAERAIPVASRRLIRVYSCLHR